MTSIASLGAAQASRAISLPRQLVAPSPPREFTLEGFRQRNALLDFLFYDLGVLRSEEAARLAPGYAREGAILAVGPSSSPRLEIWPDHAAYSAAGPSGITALAVAGVGSSALGAAAFACNVADAIGRPVLAVVSGYGLSDLVAEALGGFFLFGQLNAVRHYFEPLDALLRPGGARVEASLTGLPFDAVRKSLDVRTLVALLNGGDRFNLMVGHSKGNLVISESLCELDAADAARLAALAANVHVVTVSARIAMPPSFRRVTDVMGALDGFGELNSRRSIPADVKVPGAWHHTNTELPVHLPVTRTLTPLLRSA